ncbi:MAG: hypothetical protein LLG00_16610 [Planctomycetaceae bacterium]|nr:hypothetical protein [Planctomycetaceae bacterium]
MKSLTMREAMWQADGKTAMPAITLDTLQERGMLSVAEQLIAGGSASLTWRDGVGYAIILTESGYAITKHLLQAEAN